MCLYSNQTNMPNFDKTGPAGKGPGTGRKLGKCQGGNQSAPQGFRKGGRRGKVADSK